jgi:hypothetical protein
MMEVASTSETSVNFYQNTRRNNPEDSHPHGRWLCDLGIEWKIILKRIIDML